MAITPSRLQELTAQFAVIKGQVEQIDRKYSLDYKEPLMDMPESLDLPLLEFTPKTEGELRAEAQQQTEAGFLAESRRLDVSYANNLQRINQKILALEENTRVALAKLSANFNEETAKIKRRLTDNGLLFSTVLTKANERLKSEYDNGVAEVNLNAQNQRDAIEIQRESAEVNYANSVAALANERSAKEESAYNKLVKADSNKQLQVQKYNNQLTEKEKKYQLTRAKALENAKQAEYNRAFAARKLYQQMGSVGYEEAMLWEKYNVLVKYFANFNKREEALALIQGDSFCKGHLKQYYSTLIDWVNRNVPA